jgi:hypothetical protein
VKYNPYHKNLILSGSWDNTVAINDTRTQKTVSTILGPMISGEAIDVAHEHILLTGSYRSEEAL